MIKNSKKVWSCNTHTCTQLTIIFNWKDRGWEEKPQNKPALF